MNKPLTLPQLLMALAVIAALVFCFLAFAAEIPDPVRNIGRVGIISCVGVILLCLFWHRAVYAKPDKVPDVLATLVDPRGIFQVGAVHFTLLSQQEADRVLLVILAQNRYDQPAKLLVTLQTPIDPRFNPPPLQCEVPGSGLIEASIRWPLPPLRGAMQVKYAIIADSPRPAASSLVRLARRTAMTREVPAWQTAALAFIGMIRFGGGTFLNVDLTPFEYDPQVAPQPAAWSIIDALVPPAT